MSQERCIETHCTKKIYNKSPFARPCTRSHSSQSSLGGCMDAITHTIAPSHHISFTSLFFIVGNVIVILIFRVIAI